MGRSALSCLRSESAYKPCVNAYTLCLHRSFVQMGALKKLIDTSSAPKRVGGAAMNGAQFVAFLRKARRPRGCACARAACSMQRAASAHATAPPWVLTPSFHHATRRMPQCQRAACSALCICLPAGAGGAQLGRDSDGRLCDCDIQQGKQCRSAAARGTDRLGRSAPSVHGRNQCRRTRCARAQPRAHAPLRVCVCAGL